MILPSSLGTHWQASVRVSIFEFERARDLFEGEAYPEARAVLETSVRQSHDGESVSGIEIIKLYAWVLFFEKDMKALDRFLERISETEIAHLPEFQIIRIRRQILGNEQEAAVKACSVFISENSSPIHPLVADFLFARGLAQYALGFCLQAVEDLEIAYSLNSLSGSALGKGRVSNYLGFACLRMAQYNEALKWQGRSLQSFEELGLKKKQSMVLLNTGITYYKIGSINKSLKYLNQSHDLAMEIGTTNRQLFSNIALGNVYRIKREYGKARTHLHTAYGQAQQLQFPREEALALEFLGDVYRDESHFEDAERFYQRAMAIGMSIAPRGDIVMEVHRRLGECRLALGDMRVAQDHLGKALALAKAQEDRYEEAIIHRVVAQAWEELGEAAEARRCIDESVTILEEIGARHELAISLMVAAEFAVNEVERGRPSLPVDVMLTRAWSKATRALEQFLAVDVSWWTAKSQLLVKKVGAMRQAQDAPGSISSVVNVREDLAAYQPKNIIIHKSRGMKDLLLLCDMFAQTDEPALLVGETGTGKELLAHRLHELSNRADAELVCVNVSAISETLFEREFFGHVKGAFTGADADRLGFAGRADGGTLFLDEIGDLPLDVQPKLLRLLQDGTYFAVGDPVERRTNIRLVAATNADLNRKVQSGAFRSDLYYRLKILELEIPPVRDRQEDILVLLRHFLSEAAGSPQDLADYFNRDSLDQMERYEWPGNVREISMVARRAHVELKAKGHVDIPLVRPNGGRIRITNDSGSVLRAAPSREFHASEAVERTRILLALEECGGSRTKAAEHLEMSRATLYRRMVKLGLKGV